jgi:sugar phosphate isomerase/epimerase
MRIGLFLALFGEKHLEDALDIAIEEGVQTVEIGAGAYPGCRHLDVPRLLDSASERKSLLKAVHSRGLAISALSVHGNPLHPNRAIANDHHKAFVDAVKLADALDVGTVNGFSGCPGDSPAAMFPNWVTCAWPDEYRDVLEWQWNEQVIPYWIDQAALLKAHSVRFAIEMHPGFVCYSTETLLRLRSKAGECFGANFDPSHLWWQGIDPIVSVKQLGGEGAIFHCHAKDIRIDSQNSALNGNLDTKPYTDVAGRSWIFCTVGYGHGVDWWRSFAAHLRVAGYDGPLSIEHEDSLMSPREGLRRAVETLRAAVIQEPAGETFWARE